MLNFQSECTKLNFHYRSAPDPAGGAYTAFPDALAGGDGLALPFANNPTRDLDPSGLDPGCAVLKIYFEKLCHLKCVPCRWIFDETADTYHLKPSSFASVTAPMEPPRFPPCKFIMHARPYAC